MNAKQMFNGAAKVLSHVDIKEFGRECIAIGRSIQKKTDYNKYKSIVNPIIKQGFKSDNPEIRSIAGRLLAKYKEFK